MVLKTYSDFKYCTWVLIIYLNFDMDKITFYMNMKEKKYHQTGRFSFPPSLPSFSSFSFCLCLSFSHLPVYTLFPFQTHTLWFSATFKDVINTSTVHCGSLIHEGSMSQARNSRLAHLGHCRNFQGPAYHLFLDKRLQVWFEIWAMAPVLWLHY